MTDKQRAIEAAVAQGFIDKGDRLERWSKHIGVDIVELFEHSDKALVILNVPLSEVPAVVKPLTIAEVEVAVREVLGGYVTQVDGRDVGRYYGRMVADNLGDAIVAKLKGVR